MCAKYNWDSGNNEILAKMGKQRRRACSEPKWLE